MACQFLLASGKLCQPGSLPYWECGFDQGSQSKCMPGVNTGQLAQSNGNCQAPSPSNGCNLEFDQQLKAWMYKSNNWGVTCCNCFQLRPVAPCPANSLPFQMCKFDAGPDDEMACWGGVNTGELAAQNQDCQAPNEQNQCYMQFDQQLGAWMWKSHHATCCNCFQAKMATATGGSLLQEAAVKRHAHLRQGHSEQGDASSMLQTSLGVDAAAEPAEHSGDDVQPPSTQEL